MKEKQKTIMIVNYGMGNIGSVANALKFLGGQYFISSKRDDLEKADAFILPGVGAFGAAMQNLNKLELVQGLTNEVMYCKKPFLGICLGMQLIAKDSDELGVHEGFGWIDGHVKAFQTSYRFRVPHVGWNQIELSVESPLYRRIDDGAHFYFDHSFYLECETEIIAAKCEYGRNFVAAIEKENIFAAQFHPEKSQRNGLKLVRNFLNIVNEENASC